MANENNRSESEALFETPRRLSQQRQKALTSPRRLFVLNLEVEDACLLLFLALLLDRPVEEVLPLVHYFARQSWLEERREKGKIEVMMKGGKERETAGRLRLVVCRQ